MTSPRRPEAPFLVFPDQAGGFLVFEGPLEVFGGEGSTRAEARARREGLYVAGGLQYAAAEGPAPGWWGVFDRPRSITRADLEAWAAPGPAFVGPLTPLVDRAAYQAGFDRVRRALAEGHSYQVNLTFPVEGRAAAGPPWSVWTALRLWLDLIAHQGREAAFAVLSAQGPVLVSASPELFFHQEGTHLEARPMKGTALRHPDDPAADAAAAHHLTIDPKTRAENLMITDMLRNDLGRLARPGGVSVPRLFEVEAYPTVWQMTSTVRAEVPGPGGQGPGLTELLGALFPCASITGAPKVRTQEVIAEAEPRPRGWYTGTLGWHRPASAADGPARSRFNVLIRTLVFEKADEGRFTLGIGGGVVWDSTAEGEWDEAWAKTRFLNPVTLPFDLTEAVLWEPGQGLLLYQEHRARLAAAAAEWGLPLAADEPRASLEAAAAAWQGPPGPLKLRVRLSPRGLLTVEAEALVPLAEELTLALAPRPSGPETLVWRRFKTSDRRVYDENRAPGADQTLHYTPDGLVTEATSMTLVAEVDGQLVTPALGAGLLPGTLRAALLAEGRVVEAPLTVENLKKVQVLWLVNSVRRWKRARFVDILSANR